MLRKTLFLIISLYSAAGFNYGQQIGEAAPKVKTSSEETAPGTHWQGKRVAFLGDSITAESREGSNTVYWEYLTEWMGIIPSVYGISGHQWTGIYTQAVRLAEQETVPDAILIFAGTNDYNHGVPLGEFFGETIRQTNHNGIMVDRKYRTPVLDDQTFCGRINRTMEFLKTRFPEQQIILLTPIHRGYARFSDKNVQPEENFANEQGLYLEDYVEALKKASAHWSVPLIDLYSLSGLYPTLDSHTDYFRHAETDRLHPNYRGNYRLAQTLQYQLLALPATFLPSEH